MKGGVAMTPRESRENVAKLTLYVDADVIEAAKIEAIKQKVPVSVFVENLLREKLNLPKG
jgi:predicted HicB family RNase H-like nuclease